MHSCKPEKIQNKKRAAAKLGRAMCTSPKKRTRNAWFSLLCYRRNRVDSVPRTPWDFSPWACSGRDRPWAGGLPVGGHTCRLQGCIGARVASPQSSILHCSIDTLGGIDFTVNYSLKLCFIPARCPVSQRAVQARVTVVNLDVFEDLTPALHPSANVCTMQNVESHRRLTTENIIECH